MSWDGLKEGWPSPWALDPPKAYDEWHLRRDRIRDRLAHYEGLRLQRENYMTDYITRGQMPTQLERDHPPAQAMRSGPEGTQVLVGGIPTGGVGRADPLGTVSREQQGILPMAGLRISDEMVARACVAHPDIAPEKIRSILEVGIAYLR